MCVGGGGGEEMRNGDTSVNISYMYQILGKNLREKKYLISCFYNTFFLDCNHRIWLCNVCSKLQCQAFLVKLGILLG